MTRVSSKHLLILGAGQYGMVAREIAEAMQCFDTISFLDDNNPIAIGKLNDYEQFICEYSCATVAIGNAEIRLFYLEKLEQCGYEITTLIHPRAYVSPSAFIRKGVIVEPMAVINTESVIGDGCIISAGTIINHNAQIGDGCHLNCGSIVRARATVEVQTYVDCGQIIGE